MYGNLDAIEELNAPDRGPLAVDFSNIQVRINDFELRSTKAREVLLAGDHSSGSDLYAVSRLLGHSSPMTTLTSYIHVTDVLVGAFLNERFCAFPERLQLAIHPDFKSQLEARTKYASEYPESTFNHLRHLMTARMSSDPLNYRNAQMIEYDLVQLADILSAKGNLHTDAFCGLPFGKHPFLGNSKTPNFRYEL